VVVVAAAAPSYAVSPPAPAVVASAISGTRPETPPTNVINATVTFTNTGGAATALSALIEWSPQGLGSGVNDVVTNVSFPWEVGDREVDIVGVRAVFTRAGGLAAGASDTLTFTFGSQAGSGTLTVSAPVTSPGGANVGGSGLYDAPI
jgi:hypothetical protein